MAVTRIQSISVSSSLSNAVAHRISPPEHETLVDFDITIPSLSQINDVISDEIGDIFDYSLSERQMLINFFEYVESSGFTKKIRKNAVIQELIIAYSEDDFAECPNEEVIRLKILSDIRIFFESFRDKFGFSPFSSYFIHKHKSENMYHVHILFSLKQPDLSKKIRWKKRTYFDLIKRMSDKSPRISLPHKGKNIGAYPLWFVQKVGEKYGREIAKKIVKIAREKGYTTRELIDSAESLVKSLQQEQSPKRRSISR